MEFGIHLQHLGATIPWKTVCECVPKGFRASKLPPFEFFLVGIPSYRTSFFFFLLPLR